MTSQSHITVLRTRPFKKANKSTSLAFGGVTIQQNIRIHPSILAKLSPEEILWLEKHKGELKGKYIKVSRNGCKTTQGEVDVLRSMPDTRKARRKRRAMDKRQFIALKKLREKSLQAEKPIDKRISPGDISL